MSPAGLILGYLDWLANLAMAPGRQAEPVYKLHFLADTDVTFLLANGGHNAGVVSEPGHPRRHYQVTTRRDGERYVDAETWVAQVPATEGS